MARAFIEKHVAPTKFVAFKVVTILTMEKYHTLCKQYDNENVRYRQIC
jgi:hypothetical protein